MRTTNQQLYRHRRPMTLLALILITTAACSDDTPSTQETRIQADGQLNDGAQVKSMDASVDVADALADLREDGGSGPEAPSRVTVDLNGDGTIKILLLSGLGNLLTLGLRLHALG